MPIGKNWSQADVSHMKQNVPEKKGIYELKSFGDVVYVGSSKNLQKRLLPHLSQRNPNYYRYKTLGFLSSPKKIERQHYDRYAEKYGKPPKWNDKRP